jgi:hypothetical protein
LKKIASPNAFIEMNSEVSYAWKRNFIPNL